MKEKQLIQEQEADEQARIQAEMEEEEVRQLREQTVFKATPIKHYEMKMGKVSPKKLTVPVGPSFKTDERARLKDE